MRNKKVIAGLVAAMTFVSVTASAIVSAAGDFTVSISNTKAGAGEEFTLTLDLTDIPETGINGCEFGISYDNTLVSIESVTLGALAKDLSAVEGDLPNPFEVNIEDDVVSLMYAIGTTDSTYFLQGSGTFLNITGTVSASATAGAKAEFEVVPVDRAVTPGSTETNSTIVFGYMGEDEVPVTYTPVYTNGWVEVTGEDPTDTTEPSSEVTEPSSEVTEPTTAAPTIAIGEATKYGDVNLDNTVDVSDAVLLNLYLLNAEANPLEADGLANADVVKDNIIDSSDSTLLVNHVAMMVTVDELGK